MTTAALTIKPRSSLSLPRWLVLTAQALLIAACSTQPPQRYIITEPQDSAPPRSIDPASLKDAVPRVEPFSRYGNPAFYMVENRRYQVMNTNAGYVERGIASWYGSKFHGRRTSSGEPFDMYALTAAHPTLPIPTYAEVTNLATGRKIIVKINDRGPFKHNRLIDLSYAAAVKLGIADKGTGLVEVRAIDAATWRPAPATTATVSTAAKTGTTPPALYLQIGAFTSMENAIRLRTRLQGTPHSASSTIYSSQNNPPLYRVRIGPLQNVDEVDRVSRALLAMGLDTHVVLD
ncbi:MAG: septal ring lytic transglycosylase RlpA family protein [Chromatiales bacterium]|jgi:rare lipoprotein A|nr:septal ring lytic transglycosylase RlpA family protein [Chromatiales bacterium]